MSSTRNGKRKRTETMEARRITCPITLDLPINPVMACDGYVYEHSAITEHFRRNTSNGKAKSPMTNEMMDVTLIPSPQMADMIQAMIEFGHIEQEFANVWIAGRKIKQDVDEVIRKASNGDSDAQVKLVYYHRYGFPKEVYSTNHEIAHDMLISASDQDHPSALASHAAFLFDGGDDCKKDPIHAAFLLGKAVAYGSEHACYMMGWFYENGYQRFCKNPKLAHAYYKRMVSCKYKDTTEIYRKQANEFVLKYEKKQSD